jgi:hypothetical protein
MSFKVVGVTAFLSLVVIIYVGMASESKVVPDLELGVTLAISLLTGFGLCGLAEDADAAATAAVRRGRWPRTSDWASVVAVGLTFLWAVGKAAHDTAGLEKALWSTATFLAGAILYVVGWLVIRHRSNDRK